MSRGRGALGCGLHRTVPGHATGWSETRWSRPRPPKECAKADVLRGRPLGSSRLRHSATYRRGQNTPLLCPPCPSVELTLHEPSGCLLVFSFHFLWFVANRGIDAPTGSVVLPPCQRLPKVSRDKEPHLTRRQSVISEFLIVVQSCDDGLG